MSDLISRAAAINEFDGAKVDEAYCTEYDIGYNDGIDFAVSRLSVLPSAQPERKPGKWIPVTNGRGGHECSLCHTYAPSYKSGNEWLTDYCPQCGAEMCKE